jgi:peptidyl-prolyl cis-trans isomerase C
MIRRLKIFAIFVLLVLGCNSSKQEDEKIIVSVGDGALTLEQLNNVLPSSIRSKISQEQISNFIQQWIEMELIYQDALRLGMDKDEDVLAEFENAKREILVRNYLDRKLSNDPQITETEALEYYNENKDTYILGEDEIRALHILVSTSEEADNAYKRIRNGEEFETVAHEVSYDFIENKRVDLGYFKKADIVPEIATTVFNHRVGSLVRPIQSEFGYHIFKILDRRQKGGHREFEEVKDQIIARLKSIKRNEKYKDLIIELRNKIDYKMNIEPLKEFYKDSTFQQLDQIVNN